MQAQIAHYGSSVVALRGSSGDLVWHFKTVERDFWDFDVPSIPSVVDLQLDGEQCRRWFRALRWVLFLCSIETANL